MVRRGLVTSVNFGTSGFPTVYGKLRQKVNNLDMLNPVCRMRLTTWTGPVPTGEKLDDLAYMNYHLNFKRLFKLEKRAKLEQCTVTSEHREIVAPESGFACISPLSAAQTLREDRRDVIDKLTKVENSPIGPDDLRSLLYPWVISNARIPGIH